ncbi:unnamed protein product, partial [Ectocarpus sp. 13 AM-2016]
ARRRKHVKPRDQSHSRPDATQLMLLLQTVGRRGTSSDIHPRYCLNLKGLLTRSQSATELHHSRQWSPCCPRIATTCWTSKPDCQRPLDRTERAISTKRVTETESWGKMGVVLKSIEKKSNALTSCFFFSRIISRPLLFPLLVLALALLP